MKTIITIGSGYSGSSAIYEYLCLSNLFFDPFPSHQEFSLMYDPGGINDIENCLKNNFTPNKNKFIYDRFLRNIKFYTSDNRGLKPGYNIKLKDQNFEEILREYLDSITEVVYEGESNLLRFNNSRLVNFYKKLLFKFKIRLKDQMVLFCNINDFEIKTKELFRKIFSLNNSNQKDVILDQAGNIWSPYSSTKYFENPKALVILRDPRDVFSEFKGKTASAYPGNDVNKFCAWYENIMGKIVEEEYKNSNVIKFNFEDFILNNNYMMENISKFLEINFDVKNINFDFDYSKKNIERYKNNLTSLEVGEIKNKLKKYLYNI